MRDVWRRRQTKGLKQMFSTSERHLPRTSNKDIRSEAMMNRAKIGKDHPITLAIISKMLELEQKIVHRKFSKENFEQLLKLYSKCVEYYDSIKDPIKTYFMEKIQITVSNTKALDMLIELNEQEKEQKTKDAEENGVKVIKTFVKKDTMEFIEEKLEEKRKAREAERDRRLSFNTKKKKRAQMTNLKFKVREENKTVRVPKIIKSHFDSTQNNDQIINSNLSQQEKSIKERLEKRRQLSFQRSIVSKSGFNNTTNSVLDESINRNARGKAILKSRSNVEIGENILDELREETQNEENVAKEGKNGGYYSVSPPKHKRMMHSQSMSEVNPPSNFLSPISKSNKKEGEKKFELEFKIQEFQEEAEDDIDANLGASEKKSSSLSSIEENDEEKHQAEVEHFDGSEQTLNIPSRQRSESKTEELLAQLSDDELLVEGEIPDKNEPIEEEEEKESHPDKEQAGNQQ